MQAKICLIFIDPAREGRVLISRLPVRLSNIGVLQSSEGRNVFSSSPSIRLMGVGRGEEMRVDDL